jgi:hypothetical protein
MWIDLQDNIGCMNRFKVRLGFHKHHAFVISRLNEIGVGIRSLCKRIQGTLVLHILKKIMPLLNQIFTLLLSNFMTLFTRSARRRTDRIQQVLLLY